MKNIPVHTWSVLCAYFRLCFFILYFFWTESSASLEKVWAPFFLRLKLPVFCLLLYRRSSVVSPLSLCLSANRSLATSLEKSIKLHINWSQVTRVELHNPNLQAYPTDFWSAQNLSYNLCWPRRPQLYLPIPCSRPSNRCWPINRYRVSINWSPRTERRNSDAMAAGNELGDIY